MKFWEARVAFIAILAISIFFYILYDIYAKLQFSTIPYLYSTCQQDQPKEKVKKVLIFGLDGIGAAPSFYHTPNFQTFFNNGLYTFKGQSVIPTISGPAWGSMFHSVFPEEHNITNLKAQTEVFMKSEYPSIFRLVREKYFNDTIAIFAFWRPLFLGIIERDIGVYAETSFHDDYFMNKFYEYLEKNELPKLTLVAFDELDKLGHSKGYFTKEQLQQLDVIDEYVGKIMKLLEKKGEINDTLILLVTDHGGGGINLLRHGSSHPSDTTIFFAAQGPIIPKGKKIHDFFSILDISPIIAYSLGIIPPSTWEGTIPKEIIEFNEKK